MTDRFNELISGYLDGVLTPEEQRELADWIEADTANADRFVEAVMLDNRLDAEINAARFAKDPRSLPEKTTVSRRFTVRWVAAAACLLILAGGLVWWINGGGVDRMAQDDRDDTGFVTVVQLVDVDWGEAPPRQTGDRLGSGTLQLREGFVNLLFDDGVQVTLQGPASYELKSLGKTKLTEGLLAATVPAGAEGFTVDTPTAEIVDLGTSFGVELGDDGFSNVSVFDGEVEVVVPDTTEKHLLTEGESLRIGTGKQIDKIDFDPQRFAKVWPVWSGILGSSEVFRFVPPWPKKMRLVNSDRRIFVAAEGYAVNLSVNLKVNISKPGEYSLAEELTPLELVEGQRVRSFLLHYSPVRRVGLRRARRISGSITFDRPVLGLIVQQQELLDSSRRFQRRQAGEAQPRRQLELTGGSDGDRIALSEDRRTVTLDLISPGRSSDLIRVIVDASPQNVVSTEEN